MVSWDMPLAVASVPAGMKTGVWTSPCGVKKRPARAAPSRASTWKRKDIADDCNRITTEAQRHREIRSDTQCWVSSTTEDTERTETIRDNPKAEPSPASLRIGPDFSGPLW